MASAYERHRNRDRASGEPHIDRFVTTRELIEWEKSEDLGHHCVVDEERRDADVFRKRNVEVFSRHTL